MAQSKGIVLVTFKHFVHKRFGEAGWNTLLEALSAADQTELKLAVTIGWYDFFLRVRAVSTMDRVLGQGDGQLIRDWGHFGAESDLTTVQRAFLRLANPAYLIEKAGTYWRRFYDWGEWTVIRDNPCAATGTLAGSPVRDEIYCTELTAYLARMLELAGAKGVEVQHPQCHGRGNPLCVFVATWR